jgi:hypothetical protein
MKLNKTVLVYVEKPGQFPGCIFADWPMSGKDLADV